MNNTLKSVLRAAPIIALAAMTATASVVRLAWDPPVVPAGSPPVTNYVLEWRHGTQTNWNSTNTGTDTNVEIQIDDNMMWAFRARAQSSRGISGYTPELRLQPIPNPPRNFSVTLLDITGAVKVLAK